MFDKLMKLLGLIFFIAALFLIKKEVAFIGVDAIKKALFSVSKTGIMSALFITVVNYIILSGYDFCALIYGGKRLKYPLILKESALSFSLSNLTGHTYLSGFITRYLFLKPFGFLKRDVLMIVYFISIAVLLGLIFSFVLAVLLEILTESLKTYRYLSSLYLFAFVLIVGFWFYFKEIVQKKKSFLIGKVLLKSPSVSMTFVQMSIGFLDFLTCFLVFYALLNDFIDVQIIPVFIAFTIGVVISYLSQVPGGLGVLESSFLLLYHHTPSDKAFILSAFILFRLIYYVLPFLISIPFLWALKKKK